MKFVVFSLGCKVNQYEGQAIISALIDSGHTASDSFSYADVYVINTCSVTGEADRKSRQTISKALKLNPCAKIYICGCSGQFDLTQYQSKPNVRLISGTSGKGKLAKAILADLIEDNQELKLEVTVPPKEYEDDLKPFLTKTRGLIKIQDGCNNFCSYCIVPYLRGRSRSRSIESILLEATETAKITEEIVLTGINISAYGADIGVSLIELMGALKTVKARKRFGSLEARVISLEFLEKMKESGFCDHFHLSLQSGSNGVLKRMNRHYTIEEFIEKTLLIRSIFPKAGIMTDIIAGFPEETDSEHAETIKNLNILAFSDMHVFPYSMRKGTNAAKLKQVDKSTAVSRVQEIAKLKNIFRSEFLTSNLNSEVIVYLEETEDGFKIGHTSNFIKVYTATNKTGLIKVKLKEIYKDGIKGEEISE